MKITEIQAQRFLELLCGKVDELENYIKENLKSQIAPNKDGNSGTRERGKGINSLLDSGVGTRVDRDSAFIPPKNYTSVKEFWAEGGNEE